MIEMAKRISRKIGRGQKGQVLPIVLILLAIGGLLVAPTLDYASTSLKGQGVTEVKVKEVYAADSGVEDAINWLIHGKPTDWGWSWNGSAGERVSYEMNDRTVDVTVQVLNASNTYKVTSIATGPHGSTTVLSTLYAIHWVEGGLDVGQKDTYYGDIHVTGNVTAANKAKIVGDLIVDGDLEMKNQSELEGDASVEGNIIIGNQATITGDVVCVTGNITASNPGSITADIHFLGPDCTITLDNNSLDNKLTGNILADGNLTIILQNQAQIMGDVYAPNGNISINLEQPDASIDGTVYASGSITIVKHQNATAPPIEEHYTGDPPFEVADCPMISADPADILTYEIT